MSTTSGSSASARTPNDILLHKSAKSRINQHSHTDKVQTLGRLKNVFVNTREREALMTACSKGDLDTVTHLLTHTRPLLNPDMIRDAKLRTPLLVACAAGHAEIVRALISWGADVNNPTGDIIGNKPLDLAVVSNSVETVLVLLEAGALVAPTMRSSVPHNGPLPVPIQQRASPRSPLYLAQSRLDMLIRKRENTFDEADNIASSPHEPMIKQVIQIIRLLKHFVSNEASSSSSIEPSSSIQSTSRDLDDLTSKLSSVALDDTPNQASASKDLEVMKELRDMITRLQL
ncbi:ankyrin repeat-containing domain protein [Radiomyces spectabilis]|uniref:ankyrin repeat-containing domain protein n=1 Tax=Radiomyces spectabilis TaxID=64574 RepID=UPI00221FBA2C|nr:ankyrin repeat-containing domain protein [Radiomyces spectabilis]KAI8381413.1 ankyrin repeat-containing domain protein [Radiomyces spectabilis]